MNIILIKYKFLKSVAVAGLFGLLATFPVSADTDIRVSGNGYGTDNEVRIDTNKKISIQQTNDTTIRNDVSIDNNTGHNSTYGNTGRNSEIHTGDAVSTVSVQNHAGVNSAHVSGCNGCSNDLEIDIHGNGAFSENKVQYSNNNTVRIDQNNETDIDNNIEVSNNTGLNRSSANTGFRNYHNHHNNDMRIVTGDAHANVSIKNEAGANYANVYGHENGDKNINIHGNGAYSDNQVHLSNDTHKDVNQDNYNDFDNDVDVKNKSGYNHSDHLNETDKYRNDKLNHDHNYKKYHDKNDYENSKKYDHNKYVTDYHHDKKGSYDNHKHKDHERKIDYDKYGKDYVGYKADYYDNYKKSYDHGKKYSKVVADSKKDYVYKKNYDHGDKNYKEHDEKYKEKKYNDSKAHKHKNKNYAYVLKKLYKPVVKHVYRKYPMHYGRTNRKVLIRTGDAKSLNNVVNYASANYLY